MINTSLYNYYLTNENTVELMAWLKLIPVITLVLVFPPHPWLSENKHVHHRHSNKSETLKALLCPQLLIYVQFMKVPSSFCSYTFIAAKCILPLR